MAKKTSKKSKKELKRILSDLRDWVLLTGKEKTKKVKRAAKRVRK